MLLLLAYFLKHNKFGSNYENLKVTDTGYGFNFTTRPQDLLDKKKHVEIVIDKKNFNIMALQDYISLGFFPNYPNEIKVKLERSKLSDIRGYENLIFTLNKNVINKECKLIYFNGVEWIQLN